MIAKNTNVVEMNKALEIVNVKYESNIRWKRFDVKGKNINFTLTVISSSKKGSRRSASSFRPGRKIAAACWHVHDGLKRECIKNGQEG